LPCQVGRAEAGVDGYDHRRRQGWDELANEHLEK
jgi:hypothetical protein